MRVRIFASKDYGLEKYLNFIRLDMASGSSKPWSVEHCSPVKWVPTGPADIHIYLDVPVRLAVPWASFNVFANPFPMVPPPWAWASSEMDLIVKIEDLVERKTAIDTFRRVFRAAIKGNHPPMLPIEPQKQQGMLPPKVGIITVTRNRKQWWANMLQNVVKQSWPVSRLEWILVDDGDEGERLGPEVDAFMEKTPGIMIRYVEMLTPKSIGAKRNAAVAAASGDVDVFVCMDDDDHYPKDSVGRRVSWLHRDIASSSSSSSSGSKKAEKAEKVQSQIGYCSVLPMYDLTRYISAINVPELEISPAERVSEATLVFTREAWLSKPFPEVSMAEGLGFIEGREELTVEIPPKDVIVSFIHKGNTSSRRVPKEQEPNGCHYGFADEFFAYVHQIGGGMTPA